MLEKKDDAARFGRAGADADRGQAERDAVDDATAGVVVDQKLCDGLLGAVAGQRHGVEVVGDRVGEGAAEHGGGGGVDDPRVIVGGVADRFQQVADRVEVDGVALVEISLSLTRHNRGEVVDGGGFGREQGFWRVVGGQVEGQDIGPRQGRRGDNVGEDQRLIRQ